MVDYSTYTKYNNLLTKQMFVIRNSGVAFLNAINEASKYRSSSQFIFLERSNRPIEEELFLPEVMNLVKELEGQPGDGALEIYRDLQTNASCTNKFIDHWKDVKASQYQKVVREVSKYYASLIDMQKLVDKIPVEVMNEIKKRLRNQFGHVSENEKYRSKFGIPAMIVIVAVIIALRYFEVFTLSWFFVIPLAILAGVIFGALTSTIILTIRGR
jgi:hypothetical protein